MIFREFKFRFKSYVLLFFKYNVKACKNTNTKNNVRTQKIMCENFFIFAHYINFRTLLIFAHYARKLTMFAHYFRTLLKTVRTLFF